MSEGSRRKERHSIRDEWELCRRLLEPASQGVGVAEFLKQVTTLFHQFVQPKETEINLLHRAKYLVCRCRGEENRVRADLAADPVSVPGAVAVLEEIRRREGGGTQESEAPDPKRRGFLLGGRGKLLSADLLEVWPEASELGPALLAVPIGPEDSRWGVMVFSSDSLEFFSPRRIESLERLAEILATAVSTRNAQAALRERIKELTCLYQIALSIEEPHRSVGEILQSIVDTLPAAWLYPEDLWARLTVDASIYTAGRTPANGDRLEAPVTVAGKTRGSLEVGYVEPRPVLDEGPFLSEERRLLDTIAREVALIIERREMEENSRKLQEQLLHAERLATIGEFSASIAHEMNEPLASILGFSQLASKCPDLPIQAAGDLEKITRAVLHAREILQQLLLFARRLPSKREPLDLNEVIRASLSFLRALTVEKNISIAESLDSELPPVVGDPGQFRQVVVNLVANATQAMPSGGELAISTAYDEKAGEVCLRITDSGTGMTEEVLEKAFIPFFTTKEDSGGTGLGLSVVHGIVTAHRGTIQVESRPGEGSSFEIRIPVEANASGGH